MFVPQSLAYNFSIKTRGVLDVGHTSIYTSFSGCWKNDQILPLKSWAGLYVRVRLVCVLLHKGRRMWFRSLNWEVQHWILLVKDRCWGDLLKSVLNYSAPGVSWMFHVLYLDCVLGSWILSFVRSWSPLCTEGVLSGGGEQTKIRLQQIAFTTATTNQHGQKICFCL